MDTPATLVRRKGRVYFFHSLPIGVCFECNGNLWTKRTSRTAVGVWPAYLPEWAYFLKLDKTYTMESF